MIVPESRDSAGIQKALDEAHRRRETPVILEPAVYRLDRPVTLPRGASLVGAFPGVVSNPTQNTILRAVADLPAMLTTDTVSAFEGFALSAFLLDGNSESGVAVQAGIRIFGRKARISAVDVMNVSGVGIHLLASRGPAKSWVHWVEACHVGGCRVGIKNEASDSYFRGNYFATNRSNAEYAGGNIWSGNHFDNSFEGLVVYARDGRGSGSRFASNYFDQNNRGLVFDSVDQSPWSWGAAVSGNVFRANGIDVSVHRGIGPAFLGNVHRRGATTASAYVFAGGTVGGSIAHASIEEGYPKAFVGLDRAGTKIFG